MPLKLKLAILTILLILAGLFTVPALAGSQPSVRQVRHSIALLNRRVEALDQQYDLVIGQLANVAAQRKVTASQVASERTIAGMAQLQVSQIAVSMYENGDATNPLALLTERNAQQILAKGAIMQELSSQDAVIVRRFLGDEAVLQRLQLTEYRQKVGVSELASQRRKIRQQMQSLTRQEDALLGIYPSLSQQGSTSGHYSGPTKTQAEKAVAFAYAQLNCPYTWGGVGPCKAGFDCSGLVMQAWAYAGVSIPRTSEEQWAQLPQVSVSEMRPGDLVIMLGGSHVGMYVGHGWMIDAPHTGAFVERIRYSGWPAGATVAIVRP